MSALKNNLGLGLATVALVFSTAAAANPFENGQFIPDVIDAVKAAAPNERNAGFAAGGFLSFLKENVRSPKEVPQAFLYPQDSTVNILVIGAVVPPRGLDGPIPFCAQQNNKVLGTWNITANGEIRPVAWSGPTEGEVVPGVGVKPACGAFLKAAKADITRLAQMKGLGSPRVEAAPLTPGNK